MASAAISQLSCFSPVNRSLQYRFNARFRPKVLAVGSSNDLTTGLSHTMLCHREDATKSRNRSLKSYSDDKELVTVKEDGETIKEAVVSQPKRTAKLHDFCLGIPYGGLVLCGGLLGFILTRNPASLRTGVFFGVPLLALSTLSLKGWRKGKSSLPFILGQAVLASVLLWRSIQTYSLTKKLFPVSFYAAISSAAMLCFYSYVVLSGGNPEPKKKPSVAVQS